MLKFRTSNRTSISFNEQQLIALIEKGLSDNSLRGFLYKRSSANAKWRLKWFLLFENLLFYFDVGQTRESDQSGGTGDQQHQHSSPSKTFSSLIRRSHHQPQQQQQQHHQHHQPIQSSQSHAINSTRLANGAATTTAAAEHQVVDEHEQVLGDLRRQLEAAAQANQTPGTNNLHRPVYQASSSNIGCDLVAGGAGPTATTARLSGASLLSSGVGAAGGAGPGGGSGANQSNLHMGHHLPLSARATQNSANISGVSGHFSLLGHNEQTIGRSTTTTAGKTATANYSSLLNRKIGVIFLEGSYCERLVDSPLVVDAESCGHLPAAATGSGGPPSAGVSLSSVAGGGGGGGVIAGKANVHLPPANANCFAPPLAGHHNHQLPQLHHHHQQQQTAGLINNHLALANQRSSLAADLDIGDNVNLRLVDKTTPSSSAIIKSTAGDQDDQELLCMFTLKWRKEGSKEYQFRTETEAECQTWVHAISNARYSTLVNDKEQLEQKYLHLSQIIESESTAKWQYSRQCDELSGDIKKLQQEICVLKRQEGRTGHLRSVLERSIGIVDTLIGQQIGKTGAGVLIEPNQAAHHPSSTKTTTVFTTTTSTSTSAMMTATTTTTTTTNQAAAARLPAATRNLASTFSLMSAASSTISQPSGGPKRRLSSRFGTNEYLAEVSDQLFDDHDHDDGHQDQFYATTGDMNGRRRGHHQRLHEPLDSQQERARSADSAGLANATRTDNPQLRAILGNKSAHPSAMLARAKSMEQEQADHEQAVRRIRRRSTSKHLTPGQRLRMASFDSHGHAYHLQHQPAGSVGTRTGSPLTGTRSVSPMASCLSGQPSNGALVDYLDVYGSRSLIDHLSADAVKSQPVRQLIKAAKERGLSLELRSVVDVLNKGIILSECLVEIENSEELCKIKKVQGFFRGWLCRRRWKQIVQEYIKSPHAESMRKRNNLVFKMVECEEEYVEQLTLLISAFLRPLKMAASSQRPALDHDELNSIFLNSETLLFLHQIFLKGLTARMESWPTLVLGDLFNMLLPMLTIYQEYVRNHHFSLQVLAECKQRDQFGCILRRLEEKPQLGGRTLETFLTYPMHQIPRYIICLHEILAHTPHNHVERRSLYEAQTQLEALSCQMHDEVSETENIRQNLAIERMIIGGCDILLDVNQVFVRQGILLQVFDETKQSNQKGRSRLSSFSVRGSSNTNGTHHHHNNTNTNSNNIVSYQQQLLMLQHQHQFYHDDHYHHLTQLAQRTQSHSHLGTHGATYYANSGPASGGAAHGGQQHHRHSSKELVRQCFLFTNHLLLCTRTKEGKLRLLDNIGRISLAEVTLIECPLEFVQQHQHETLIAESNFHHQQQQQQLLDEANLRDYRQQQASAQLKKLRLANSNNLCGVGRQSDHSGPSYAEASIYPDGAPRHADSTKRASTASVPGKWTTNGRTPVGFAASSELAGTAGTTGTTGIAGGQRAPSGVTNLTQQEATTSTDHIGALGQPQRQPRGSAEHSNNDKNCVRIDDTPAKSAPTGKSGSFRSGITGYLASKLSNLTGFNAAGGIGNNNDNNNLASNNNNNNNSCSMPSSPSLSKRGQQCSAPATPIKLSKQHMMMMMNNNINLPDGQRTNRHSLQSPMGSGAHTTSTGGATNSAANSSPAASPMWSVFEQSLVAVARTTRDFNGCDFLLLVESKSLSSAGGCSNSSSAIGQNVQTGKSQGQSSGVVGSGGGGSSKTSHASQTTGASAATQGVNCTLPGGSSASTATPNAGSSGASAGCSQQQHQQMLIIHLVAPSLQEKTAWISDISQCIDNVHFNDIFQGATTDSSTSVTINQSVRADPRLHMDDVDIKFSRALNSCKLPQIRYASKGRLFERLTDLRFLSIDFLNTFLLTYRVFTTAEDVLEALKSVHYNSERYFDHQNQQGQPNQHRQTGAGGVQQRDSFSSAQANYCSSMTSLVNQPGSPMPSPKATTTTTGQLHQPQHRHQRRASLMIPGSQADQTGQTSSANCSPNKQAPPLVPPRSPGLSSNLAAHVNPDENNNNNFLVAPNLSQKRRSTISALTQITGSSNSSSLVNLAKSSAEKATIGQQQVSSQEHTRLSRQPSSSLSSASQSGATKQPTISKNTEDETNRLAVPSGRQVRANSLTSVVCLTPDQQVGLGRDQSVSSSSVKSSEQVASNAHWRLSYKKSSNGKHKGAPSGDFLTATNLTTSSVRRKSAADADVIRLQITLDGAPIDQQVPSPLQAVKSAANSDYGDDDDDNAADHSSRSQLLLFNYPPNVPPSTPIPPTGGSSTSSLVQAAGKVHGKEAISSLKKSHRASNRKRHRKKHASPSQITSSSSSYSSSSSSSSSSSRLSSSDEQDDDDDLHRDNHRNHRRNRSSQTNSVSTSQSESGLIQSTSSGSISSASIELNKTTNKPKTKHSVKHINGLKKTARPQRKPQSNQILLQSSTTTTTTTKTSKSSSAIQRADSRRQQSLILKEIDLTTQAKLLDFDTSADDSEAQTSSTHSEEEVEAEQASKAPGEAQDELTVSLSNVKLDGGKLDEPANVTTKAGNKADEQQSSRAQSSPPAATAPLPPPPPPPVSQRPPSGATSRPVTSNSCLTTPRSSFQHTAAESLLSSKAGVVVTSKSPRVSSRRSSTASAASAFAAATAASCNPLLTQPRNNNNLGQPAVLDQQLINCSCAQLHRGSISSIQLHQQRQRSHLIDQFALNRGLQFAPTSHHPSCIHYHTTFQSDNSSNNSRANSRLSSCAGLEFNSTSLQQQQQQQQMAQRQQQPTGAPNRGPTPSARQQPITSATSCSRISSSASTSCNQSKRNSQVQIQQSQQQQQHQQNSNVRSMATLRVLSVLRHWVSKHSQDFVNDTKLSYLAQEFLQDLIMDSSLLPAEHKAAIQLQQMIQKAAHMRDNQTDLDTLLAPPPRPSPDTIETLSALEIAETMTYLDHKIFLAIKSEEFLGQAWMKADKAIKAPHILLITKRFNDVSRLVSSEIIRVPELHRRVLIIEKWTNVAHICRVIHNFNGVLQICAAFTNSAVFRLKKTWDKIPKTTKATIDQLQNLVSTDSRFRNMRDAINRCDPPSIPYVGMYLTDLSFIEEGTPNYSPEGLLNFSKMRMIAHVIREIQHLQNGVYKLNFNTKVANYLLDASRHLQDDEMYRCSLAIEPRSSGTKNGVQLMTNVTSSGNNNNSGPQQTPNMM